MVMNKSSIPVTLLSLALLGSLALAGCSSPQPAAEKPTDSTSADSNDSGTASGDALGSEDFDLLLSTHRSGVAVLAQQWEANNCSVSIAVSPDDILCSTILSSADLAGSYEDLTGGLATLGGDSDTAQALRDAFEESGEASDAWAEAGCAAAVDPSCAEEGDRLIASLLSLRDAFDAWAA